MKLLFAYILTLFFSNNSFENEVNIYLQKYLDNYAKYEFTIEENFLEYQSIEINYERSSNRIGHNFFLPVKLVDRYGIEREKFLKVDLKIYENVLVVNRLIKKGETLNQTNTMWEVNDITSLSRSPIKNENQMNGMIAKYDLQPGEIVCSDYVENNPVIQVGEQVKLYYGLGSVVINFIGVTRQAGAIGDVIKVRSNGRQYSARIINSNEVLIIE